MFREACIIVLVVCSIFSLVPLTWIVRSPAWSMVFFLIILVFAAFDIKRLYDNKERGLARRFVFFLFLSIVVSVTALALTWRFFMPPIIA